MKNLKNSIMKEQNIYMHYVKIVKTIKSSLTFHHFIACQKMIFNFSRLFKDRPRMASDLIGVMERELKRKRILFTE